LAASLHGAAFATRSFFDLLSLCFLSPTETTSEGDARKAGVEEEMCKIKGKNQKCQIGIAAAWEVDPLSSLSVSPITTYPVWCLSHCFS